MDTILAFIVMVMLAMSLNRSMAWGRRALARHRKQWNGMGFKENNPAWRLRQDSYRRVALKAYVVFGLIITIWASTQRGFNMVGVLAASLTMPSLPTLLVWYVYRTYKEFTVPYGEVALEMRDKQFHKIIKPLIPQGEYGTAEKETPASIGIVFNPLGWVVTRPQPIVEEEVKQ